MRPFNSSFQSLKTALGGLLLLSFAVGFLCVSFAHLIPTHAGMDMGMTHTMRQTSQATTLNSCCGAETTNHMELWKSTLTGIPQVFQDLLALIVFAVAATFVFSDFFATTKLNSNFFLLRYKQYAREHPNIKIFDALRLAFATGLLNPKTH